MKLWLYAFVILALPGVALAQNTRSSRGEGYLLVAPLVQPKWGGVATYIGGGGEVFLFKGASVGAEIGPIISGGYVFGLGSANVAYHFMGVGGDDRIEPFLTAGYATTFRAGIQKGSNAGAGLNFRIRRNVAVRFEMRAYGGRLRISGVSPRFGVTFR